MSLACVARKLAARTGRSPADVKEHVYHCLHEAHRIARRLSADNAAALQYGIANIAHTDWNANLQLCRWDAKVLRNAAERWTAPSTIEASWASSDVAFVPLVAFASPLASCSRRMRARSRRRRRAAAACVFVP